MKQLREPKKICLYVIIALIIIVGIIMVLVKGFNVELRYTANKKVELVIGETVQVSKIQEKADEVFGKGKSIVQIVEVYKDTVQVTAKDITEEQKNSLVEKINELYPQEVKEDTVEEEQTADAGESTDQNETNQDAEAPKLLDASEITIQSVQNARLRDFLRPYVLPITIVTLVILVYFAIVYRKLGVVKVFFKVLLIIALSQLVLLSILAIVRFPMGRFTAPLILLVYLSSLIYSSGMLIKDAKMKK